MGHINSENHKNLQKRLDFAIQGTPESDTLFEILEILFTEKEAGLVSVLPMNLANVARISKIWKKDEEETKKILDGLAGKGILMDIAKDNESYYVLAPPMAGFFEFSIMRTDGRFDREILSELFYQYINVEKDFAKTLFSLNIPIDRVFVQEHAVDNNKDQSEILDYEKASKVIDTATCITVGTCYCRHKMEHKGKACDQPQEVCLTFNKAAKTLSKHGIAKEISKEEAHKILKECIDNGLVQIGDNIQDSVGWICNCCGCCCEALLIFKELGYCNIGSNYLAEINQEKCTQCGLCVKKCPVDTIKKEDRVEVMQENCIGCGVCARFCPAKAIELNKKDKRQFVPKDNFERFILTAIDDGKLQNYIFDNYHLWTNEILRAFFGVILKLKPAKKILVNDQLQSRYLNMVTKAYYKFKKNIPDEDKVDYSHPEMKGKNKYENKRNKKPRQ